MGCPCAACRSLRDRGEQAWPRPASPQPLRLTDAALHGAWGLQLTWNDGHATGIFPFEALRRWSEGRQALRPIPGSPEPPTTDQLVPRATRRWLVLSEPCRCWPSPPEPARSSTRWFGRCPPTGPHAASIGCGPASARSTGRWQQYVAFFCSSTRSALLPTPRSGQDTGGRVRIDAARGPVGGQRANRARRAASRLGRRGPAATRLRQYEPPPCRTTGASWSQSSAAPRRTRSRNREAWRPSDQRRRA